MSMKMDDGKCEICKGLEEGVLEPKKEHRIGLFSSFILLW
jgi:hypothetical protein